MNKKTITMAALAVTMGAGAVQGCASAGQCTGVTRDPTTKPGEKVLVNLDRAGVAIQGYDPVAYFTDKRPVKGRSDIRSKYRGAVYHFANEAHKVTFDADPAKYAPQFGGWCAYAAALDALSPIDPNYWQIVDGRLILNHNDKAARLWREDVPGHLAKADKNWPGLVERNGSPLQTLVNVDGEGLALMGYDPTAYFIDNQPRRGDPKWARTYQGATYYFVDKTHKDAFEKEPAKYVPQFGGFCGYAASIDRLAPVDPHRWQIVNGRLVLQYSEEAYRLFNEDLDLSYSKAEQNWPGLTHRRCS